MPRNHSKKWKLLSEEEKQKEESQYVEVKKSTIPNAGRGLFALVDFRGTRGRKGKQKAGSFIVEYRGPWIDLSDEKAWPTTGEEYTIVSDDLKWMIDGYDPKKSNVGRYTNEIRPENKTVYGRTNAYFTTNKINKEVNIRALRNIKAGEEIFVNYCRLNEPLLIKK